MDFVRSEGAKTGRFAGFLTDRNVRPTFCRTRQECGTFLSLPDGSRRTAHRGLVSGDGGDAFEEALELFAADGVLEFSDGFGFDLSDAFACDFEDASDFFEGVGVAVTEAVAEFDDFAFAVGEGFEDGVDFVFEHFGGGVADGAVITAIFDEVAEGGVIAFADGFIEADGLSGDSHDAAGFFEGDAGGFGHFFDGGFSSDFLQEDSSGSAKFRHGFDHVDRYADGAGLIGDCAGDGLSDPPGGIGGEFVAASVFVFIDSAHEAGVAFLDEVEEGESAVAIFFGDGDDESEVSAGEIAHGFVVFEVALCDGFDFGGERVWGVLGDVDEFVEFFLEVFAFVAGGGEVAEAVDLFLEFGHAGGDLFEPFHAGLESLRAEAEFFEEGDAASAAFCELLSDGDLFFG